MFSCLRSRRSLRVSLTLPFSWRMVEDLVGFAGTSGQVLMELDLACNLKKKEEKKKISLEVAEAWLLTQQWKSERPLIGFPTQLK